MPAARIPRSVANRCGMPSFDPAAPALKLKAQVNARCSVDSQYRHSISELQQRLCVTPADSDRPNTATTQPF